MSEDVTSGLPRDLASVLRDQSVVMPQDAAVFELLASWANAPAVAASSEVAIADADVLEAVYDDTLVGASTTPAGCC
jgi:hypothetical protein